MRSARSLGRKDMSLLHTNNDRGYIYVRPERIRVLRLRFRNVYPNGSTRQAQRTTTRLPAGPRDGSAGGRASALGLIPHFCEKRPDFAPIHARAETIAEKEWFRDAY